MSDTHLGFAPNGREEDAFLTFAEGIEQGMQADGILVGGDVFDTRVPSAETFSRSMEILLKARRSNATVQVEGDSWVSGTPVIMIHGNHERRVKGLVNPVHALSKGGFVIHLHASHVELVKGEERVAVHGLSAVPEQYLAAALEEWSPQPVTGAFNILMIHQNLEGFVRAPGAFPKERLPEGFDLYICGDIHESHQSQVHGSPLLLPGSTVATQVTKDAQTPRRYWIIDTAAGNMDPHPFEHQRVIHYKEFSSQEEATSFLETVSPSGELTPLVKIKGSFPSEELKARFKDQVLLRVQEEVAKGVSPEMQAVSVQESGKKILAEQLEKEGLDPQVFEQVFELLLEGKRDEVITQLRQQKGGNA